MEVTTDKCRKQAWFQRLGCLSPRSFHKSYFQPEGYFDDDDPGIPVTELPGVILKQIFGNISFAERHNTLPLVCKRFAEICNDPSLWRSLEFDTTIEQDVLTTNGCVSGRQAVFRYHKRCKVTLRNRANFAMGFLRELSRRGKYKYSSVSSAALNWFTRHSSLAEHLSIVDFDLAIWKDNSLGHLLSALPLSVRSVDITLQHWSAFNDPAVTLAVALSRFSNLQSLDLAGLSHYHRLNQLSALTSLTSLRMLGNMVPHFPEWVCKLTNLRSIDLQSYRAPDCHYAVCRGLLSELPQNLTALTALTFFVMKGRHGYQAGDDEVREYFLEEWLISEELLAVAQNGIINVDYDLLWMQVRDTIALPRLKAEGAFPDVFPMAQSLTFVSIPCNGITILPASLFRLPALAHLDVSSNKVEELPEAVGNLSQLQTLNLSSNRLSKLPSSMSKLCTLRNLNLAFNKFARFPQVLAGCQSLSVLTVDWELHNGAMWWSVGSVHQGVQPDGEWNVVTPLEHRDHHSDRMNTCRGTD